MKRNDSKPGDDDVWIGSLAGYEVWTSQYTGYPMLYHRCGWTYELTGANVYLGNIIDIALGHRQRTCRGDGY